MRSKSFPFDSDPTFEGQWYWQIREKKNSYVSI